MINYSPTRKLSIVTFAATLFLLASILPTLVSPANSAYSGAAKPMEFYLHFIDQPVTVAGLQTKYVMNTTRFFSFLSQQQAHENSFYKPIGQPKIVVDFYLYPNLANSLTISGMWQVFVWVNGSAYKPTGFGVRFEEVTLGGVVLWDSGTVPPIVTSTVGEYIDVPVYNYNLSTSLTHTFTADTTLHVSVEINSGSSADTRIWYDSPFYPSKVILPAEDYARPVSVKTYSVDNSERTLFNYNWSENERKVIVRANVTDPFGGYDVYRVNLSILDPAGESVVNDTSMVRTFDGQWLIEFSRVFEANWSYPENATRGEYTVIVTVTDNNGYYRTLDTGAPDPFIEEVTTVFTIGIVVYYDPSFLVTDDVNEPLANAQVYVTWPNGTRDGLPTYTSMQGFINLSHIPEGYYGFIILWKDALVQQTIVHVESNGPYTIKTQVYRLTVQLFGNDGAAIHGAYVIVFTDSGVGYGLDTTNASGMAVFKLPSGSYSIQAHYTSEYWLTVVRATATKPALVTSSHTETIVLNDFPPALWSTLGFLLILTLIIGAIVAVAVVFFMIRVKARH